VVWLAAAVVAGGVYEVGVVPVPVPVVPPPPAPAAFRLAVAALALADEIMRYATIPAKPTSMMVVGSIFMKNSTG
jgi:hypothetical protein